MATFFCCENVCTHTQIGMYENVFPIFILESSCESESGDCQVYLKILVGYMEV